MFTSLTLTRQLLLFWSLFLHFYFLLIPIGDHRGVFWMKTKVHRNLGNHYRATLFVVLIPNMNSVFHNVRLLLDISACYWGQNRTSIEITSDAKVSGNMFVHFSCSETRFRKILKSYSKSTSEEVSHCMFKKISINAALRAVSPPLNHTKFSLENLSDAKVFVQMSPQFSSAKTCFEKFKNRYWESIHLTSFLTVCSIFLITFDVRVPSTSLMSKKLLACKKERWCFLESIKLLWCLLEWFSLRKFLKWPIL